MINGKSLLKEGLKFDSYWIDLLMILLLIYIQIAVVLIPSLKNEYETKINLLKKHNKEAHDSFGTDTPIISIGFIGTRYIFYYESKKTGIKKFNNIKELISEITRLHPQNLILRVDKEAAFKYPQEILIAARKLNIELGFAYEVGGG